MRIWAGARGGLWLAVALGCATACDDGGSGETCGRVAPCGGEVVGEWQVGAACLGAASTIGDLLTTAVGQVCPAATIGPLALEPSGSLSFRADLTFSASLSVDVSTRLGFPSSCLDGVPCSLAGLALQAALARSSIPSAMEALDCTGTATCTCTLVAHAPTLDEAGSYARAGSSLILRGSSGTATADYCMQEPELHLMARSGSSSLVSSSSSSSSSLFAADLVATKLW